MTNFGRTAYVVRLYLCSVFYVKLKSNEMKITEIKGNVTNVKVFKPIQYLNVTGWGKSLSGKTLRVRLVNSETGRVEEIIPSMDLGVLAEITSMNEGFFISDGTKYNVNVMLHPTSAINLSNDKYLEVDLMGVGEEELVSMYGLESPVIDKDFVCRYNKFYMAAGELQKTFSVGENENLVIPKESFEEVVLHYKNGSSCTYTTHEIEALMNLKNDIVCAYGRGACMGDPESAWIYFGSRYMYGLDVSEVSDFTLRRTNSTESFEVVMIDTIKE